MNLGHCLEMAGSALLALLDPEKDLMPTDGYEVAHDLGRWWDAVLRLEEAIGFVIPAELEAASLRNLERLTDNPDRLLMNRLDVPWLCDRAKINPHNFRESLLAFGDLVRRRQSAWAREAGLQLVRSMDRCLKADGSFDFTQLGCWGQMPHTDDPSHTEPKRDGWFDGTATSGRSLEALVWFFEATGEPLVLDVARRIAQHHLRFSTNRDGSVRSEIVSRANVGHNHSYHGTLRGLLRFGLLTGQKEYVDVVEATYRHADHGRIVMESGWAPHDLGMLRSWRCGWRWRPVAWICWTMWNAMSGLGFSRHNSPKTTCAAFRSARSSRENEAPGGFMALRTRASGALRTCWPP